MPINFTPEQLDQLWEANADNRKAMIKRGQYYDGYHAIASRKETYADGNAKTNRVTNFASFAVDLYVGALCSSTFQVSKEDQETSAAIVEEYTNISKAQRLNARDSENLSNALIYGYAVEFHSYSNGGIIIQTDNPIYWMPIIDSSGETLGAIKRVTIQAGTVHGGVILAQPIDTMTVYDESRIYNYERNVGASAWQLISETVHAYRKIPVIFWTVNDYWGALISDDLIGQMDEYNEIDSASGDAIRFEVDAMLLLKGYSPSQLLAPVDPAFPEGETVAAYIKRMKILPLHSDADARYLVRDVSTESVENKLQRTRENIHRGFRIPDFETMTGATGATSGIALKLKFFPMESHAATMVNYIKKGMSERIELINAILSKLAGRQPIDNYTVTIQFYLPVNRIEEWQNIKGLDGTVTKRTQLELLSDIHDPEKEYQQLQIEQAERAEQQPEANAVAREMRIQQGANRFLNRAQEAGL